MPPLPKFFRDLLHSATPVCIATAGHFEDKPAPTLRIIAAQALELLGAGMGALLIRGGVDASSLRTPLTAVGLRAAPGVAQILAGEVLAPRRKHPAVVWIQRGMQALAARRPNTPAALRLSHWGADDDFGGETVAGIKAWQAQRGQTVDGRIGPDLVRALIDALDDAPPPDLLKGIAPIDLVSPGARQLVRIATSICESTSDQRYTCTVDGDAYTYSAQIFGTEAHARGKLRAPGGVSYGLRPGTSYWKCNIFAGTVIALADLPVPSFRWSNRATSLHFPRAERFGPRLARLPGWRMVSQLDHRDPDDETQALRGFEQQTDISELLLAARPGDLLFVDHPGAPGNDGGHCRVCITPADPDDPDLAPRFAQASADQARISADGLAKMGDGKELQFWLVRYVG